MPELDFSAQQAYQQGYRDGLVTARPYSPCPTYSGEQLNAYRKGFDAAIDSKG